MAFVMVSTLKEGIVNAGSEMLRPSDLRLEAPGVYRYKSAAIAHGAGEDAADCGESF